MRKIYLLLGVSALLSTAFIAPKPDRVDWGFFAHKRINRLAVFTLPPEMQVFFKANVDWLSDHAADPDMRRYASPVEAPRHYIDLDNYGPPFDSLPRTWAAALARYSDVWMVKENGDTVLVYGAKQFLPEKEGRDWLNYVRGQLLPAWYRGETALNPDSMAVLLKKKDPAAATPKAVFYRENLSQHGILPWHLQKMQRDLTAAFKARDSRRILHLSADIGHYIGDSHVPLHTSSNYNGQKTGQDGIHGFWESRIPELFADETYDYFVGKPEYIENTTDFFWANVLESNRLVDSVLTLERAMRLKFPPDRQMCPDMRNGLMIVMPCRDFAAAYQDAMQGMVERRMRAAIHAVSSAWYTAWVDAGQPIMSNMDVPLPSEAERLEEERMRQQYQQGKIQGRPEEH